MKQKPQIGDVFEIPTVRGLVYAQLTHEHPHYGALLRILEGYFGERPVLSSDLLNRTRFFTFVLLDQAVHSGLFARAGHTNVPTPLRRLPPVFIGARHESLDLPPKWVYWDGEREWLETGPRPPLENLSIFFPGLLVQALEADARPVAGDLLLREVVFRSLRKPNRAPSLECRKALEPPRALY
jgi:hypothetical protein